MIKFTTALLLCLGLFASAAQADKMTAMRAGCMGCHQPDKATVGPSIQDIAAKHKGSSSVDDLVALVKKGKTADELTWGKMPMPASPASEADVKIVVEWMLTH